MQWWQIPRSFQQAPLLSSLPAGRTYVFFCQCSRAAMLDSRMVCPNGSMWAGSVRLFEFKVCSSCTRVWRLLHIAVGVCTFELASD
jgi:hypothetical protein